MNTASSEKSQVFFDNLISFLIATVTVILAVISVLQIDASHTSEKANRAAQQLSMQVTEKRISGIMQFNHDWYGVYSRWVEGERRAISADQENDAAARDRYETLRNNLSMLSPLLREPYFDPEKQFINTSKYAAELYIVDATDLLEQFSAMSKVGQHWNNVADNHVVQLTLLAVALSLFGLSNTMTSRIRWIFVSLGGLLVLLSSVWAAVLLIDPAPAVNYEAIHFYAEGVGKSYQESYDEAIQLFDQAIRADPEYANAYYERGSAYYERARKHFARGNLDLSRTDYAAAAADYESALKAGRDDMYVNWNLGWTYYLLGDFERARQTNERVLQERPDLVGMRLNQALVMLTEGKFDEARATYTEALNEAARQVGNAKNDNHEPPSSLWLYIDAGVIDLQNLYDQVNGTPKAWTQAPDLAAIHADSEQLKSFITEQIKTIKEASVALESTWQLPNSTVTIQVEPFQFGHEVYDEEGNYTGFDSATSFEYGTGQVTVTFDYSGYVPRQQVLWKVYINGIEYPSYREIWTEGLEESGNQIKYIGFGYTNSSVLSAGEYTVEVYVDSRLAQRGTFTVLEEQE